MRVTVLPDAEAVRYEASIRAARVDLQILGNGANGLIGVNEPGASLRSLTHVGVLARHGVAVAPHHHRRRR